MSAADAWSLGGFKRRPLDLSNVPIGDTVSLLNAQLDALMPLNETRASSPIRAGSVLAFLEDAPPSAFAKKKAGKPGRPLAQRKSQLNVARSLPPTRVEDMPPSPPLQPTSPRGRKSMLRPRPKGAVGNFLRILSVNDVYEMDKLPQLAFAIKAYRQAAAELDCTFVSTMNGGKASLNALDLVDPDYLCLGNYEFDIGIPNLAKKLKMWQDRGKGKWVDDVRKRKVLLANNLTPELKFLPTHDLLPLGPERTALFTGLCTPDKSLYAPSACPELGNVDESAEIIWDMNTEVLGSAPDVFVPLTHQLIHEDEDSALKCAAHPELGSRTPVILGGHEHEVYMKAAGNSIIVKAGTDATKFAFTDIWWDKAGRMHSKVEMEDASLWKALPRMRALSEKKAKGR